MRPELIRSHMRFLADDLLEGRGTGTRGFQIAAAYVAAQFEALGLEPAFGQTFFQPIPLRHAEAVGGASSITLHRGASNKYRSETRNFNDFADESSCPKRQLTYGVDFVTSGDIHRESASVDAPIVFVGDGISAPTLGYDDYAEVDVRGKIVAIALRRIPILRPAPAAYFGNLDVRIEAAIERGAVGFLNAVSRRFVSLGAKSPACRLGVDECDRRRRGATGAIETLVNRCPSVRVDAAPLCHGVRRPGWAPHEAPGWADALDGPSGDGLNTRSQSAYRAWQHQRGSLAPKSQVGERS